MGFNKYRTALKELEGLNITPLELNIYNTLDCVLENYNISDSFLEKATATLYEEYISSPGVGFDELIEDALTHPKNFVEKMETYRFYDRRLESVQTLNEEMPPFSYEEKGGSDPNKRESQKMVDNNEKET